MSRHTLPAQPPPSGGAAPDRKAGLRAQEFLRLDEVAELVGKHRNTVYLWHKQGMLPARVWLGRKQVWRTRDILRWIEHLAVAIED